MKWIHPSTVVIDSSIKLQKTLYNDVFVILIRHCISCKKDKTIIKTSGQVHFLKKTSQKIKIEQVVFDWFHQILLKVKEVFKENDSALLESNDPLLKPVVTPIITAAYPSESINPKSDTLLSTQQHSSQKAPRKSLRSKFLKFKWTLKILYICIFPILIAFLFYKYKTVSLSEEELKILVQKLY